MATPFHRGVIADAAAAEEEPKLVARPSIELEKKADDQVLRVWHLDDCMGSFDEKDVAAGADFTAFKCIRASTSTATKTVVDSIGRKLLVADASLFRLYAINSQTKSMQLLEDDEYPLQRFNVNAPNIKLGFLYRPQLKTSKKQQVKDLVWQPYDGDLTHRRLLNDQVYSKFSDLTLVFDGGRELYTFQAITSIRIPNLPKAERLIKKKKERKGAGGNVQLTIEVLENSVSYETMQQVLDWAYTGKINFLKLNVADIMRIIVASEVVGTPALAQLCEIHLKSELGTHNIFPFLKHADEMHLDDLKVFAIEFSVANWSVVMTNKEGLNIIGIDLFQELTLAMQRGGDVPAYVPPDMPPNTVVDDFRRIYEDMPFHDALATFEGENVPKVPFHRAILAACSDKLSAKMFSLKEPSSKSKLPSVRFENVSPDAFYGFLQLLYYGESNMDAIAACTLLEHFVVPYGLVVIRDKCEEIISGPLSTTTVLPILRITYLKLNDGRTNITDTLRHRCLSYAVKHYSDIDIEPLRTFGMPELTFDLLSMFHERCMQNKIRGIDPPPNSSDAALDLPIDDASGASSSSAAAAAKRKVRNPKHSKKVLRFSVAVDEE